MSNPPQPSGLDTPADNTAAVGFSDGWDLVTSTAVAAALESAN